MQSSAAGRQEGGGVGGVRAFGLRFLSLLTVCLGLEISVGLIGCDRGGSGKDIITEADNDIRVGRTTIRCGVPQAPQDVVNAVQGVVNAQRALRGIGAAPQRPKDSFVPVAVHVVASSETQGNISDEDILGQVDVLNASYAATGTPYQFYVASVDRVIDPLGAAMTIGSPEEAAVKSQLRLGGPETLNLYFADPPDGTLGWATFPWSYEGEPSLDGVVIAYQTVPNGAYTPYDQGITAVHEVGHWLGLFHTFQDGCTADNDLITDTPAEQVAAYGCEEGRDTCGFLPGRDPVHNYMDYSDDSCLTEFSAEQVDRMVTLSSVYRGL